MRKFAGMNLNKIKGKSHSGCIDTCGDRIRQLRRDETEQIKMKTENERAEIKRHRNKKMYRNGEKVRRQREKVEKQRKSEIYGVGVGARVKQWIDKEAKLEIERKRYGELE